MPSYFVTGCIEKITNDLPWAKNPRHNDSKPSNKIECILKSHLRPLVLILKRIGVQVWHDKCDDRLLLAKCILPSYSKVDETVEMTYRATWHPLEADLFAVLYEGCKIAVFLLNREYMNERCVGKRIHAIKCLYYLDLRRRSFFRSATSILAVGKAIFVFCNSKHIARLSWSCAFQEIQSCNENVDYITYVATISCIGMVMGNGEVCICFFHNIPLQDIFSALLSEQKYQVSIMVSPGNECQNNRATTLSINDKTFRLAVGTADGDVYVYSFKEENSIGYPKNKDSNKRISATQYSKISLQEFIDDPQFLVGSVSVIEWSTDGKAIATGYSKGGFAVWSPDGELIFSPLSCVLDISTSMNLVSKPRSKEQDTQNVSALTWLSSSFNLLVASGETEDSTVSEAARGFKWSLKKLFFLKSIDVSTLSISKFHTPILIGAKVIYRYTQHRRRKKWIRLHPLEAYIEKNAPLCHCAMNPSATHLALAGKSSFLIFEEATSTWVAPRKVSNENELQCVGLLWLNDSILICSHLTSLTFWNITKSNCEKVLSIPLSSESCSHPPQFVSVIKRARQLCVSTRSRSKVSATNFVFISLMYCLDLKKGVLRYKIDKLSPPIFGYPILKACYLPHGMDMHMQFKFVADCFILQRNNGNISFLSTQQGEKVYNLGTKTFVNIWYSELNINHLPTQSKIFFWVYEKDIGLQMLTEGSTLFSLKQIVDINSPYTPIGVIPDNGMCVSFSQQLKHVGFVRRAHSSLTQRQFSCNLVLMYFYLLRSDLKMLENGFHNMLNLPTCLNLIQILVENAYEARHVKCDMSAALLQKVLKMCQNHLELHVKVMGRSARLIERSRWDLLFPYAGNARQLQTVCLQFNDLISAAMYVNIIGTGDTWLIKKMHTSTKNMLVIENGARRAQEFLRYERRSAVKMQLKIYIRRLLLMHVESMREYFHLTDMFNPQ